LGKGTISLFTGLIKDFCEYWEVEEENVQDPFDSHDLQDDESLEDLDVGLQLSLDQNLQTLISATIC
jgi:hypothetical protein